MGLREERPGAVEECYASVRSASIPKEKQRLMLRSQPSCSSRLPPAIVVGVAAVLAVATGCAGGAGRNSNYVVRTRVLRARWAATPVTIDGDGTADWADAALAPMMNDLVDLAAKNDGQSLYIMVHTTDASQTALLRQRGFALAFDMHGGYAKAVELAIPPVEEAQRRQERPSAEQSGQAPGPAVHGPRAGADTAPSIQLWRVGQADKTLPLRGASEAEVAAGVQGSDFCEEVRISLATLGASPGQTIAFSIRALTPAPRRPEQQADPASLSGMSGRSSAMAGPGRRGGGRMAGAPAGPTTAPSAQAEDEPGPAKSVELWMNLPLARPPP